MSKNIIIEADTAEKLAEALQLLEKLNGISIKEALPVLPQKNLSEAERAKLWATIQKGTQDFDLETALEELAERKKDKPLPFRDYEVD